jgi:ribulose-phosphate 3-epimerase
VNAVTSAQTGSPVRLKIAPSILTADFGRLAEQIRAAEEGGADSIHLDIMDGQFVPNISFGPLLVSAVRHATSLPLDVHLMIVEPERYIPAFVEAGATSITVHQEVAPHLQRVIAQIKELGARAGLALNPATPLVTVEDVLVDLDLLLVMSVNPGFGGQVFLPQIMDKLRRARAMLDAAASAIELEVDGGVHTANIAEVAEAGARVFVTGSAVFSPRRPVREALAELRARLARASL